MGSVMCCLVRMGAAADGKEPPSHRRVFFFLISSGGCYVTWLSGVTLVRQFVLAGCTTPSVKHRYRFTRRKYNTVIITNNTVVNYSGTMHALL